MEREITGFHADEDGHWVAELSCLHGQHIRHQPPFRNAAWVIEAAGRAARIGAPLDCPLCDRAELPDGLVRDRVTSTWDETSAPRALQRNHRVARGVWGQLGVDSGAIRFVAQTTPVIDRVVSAGEFQPIPPELEHQVEVIGPVRFAVEFLVPMADDEADG